MAYRVSRGLNFGPVEFLIALNFVVFVVTVIRPDLQSQLGFQPAGLSARPWTIITNLFVHRDIWHILANMVTLYFFGSYLLQLIGMTRFFIVYFVGGILGNLFFMLLASPYSIGIGASGAVFAVGGALTAMRPNLRVFVFPIPAPLPLWVAVIGGFLVLSLIPFVAWQAHLGGLVLGLVLGYVFRRRERRFF